MLASWHISLPYLGALPPICDIAGILGGPGVLEVRSGLLAEHLEVTVVSWTGLDTLAAAHSGEVLGAFGADEGGGYCFTFSCSVDDFASFDCS